MTDIVMKASSCHLPPARVLRGALAALARLLSSSNVRFKTLPELRVKDQRAKRKNRIRMRSHLPAAATSRSRQLRRSYS